MPYSLPSSVPASVRPCSQASPPRSAFLLLRSSRPPESANFETSVLPISSTSGGLLPASAVVVFSWMPSHCWIWILTWVFGCAWLNWALTRLMTASGAEPFISQTVMSLAWVLPLPPDADSGELPPLPHAAANSATVAPTTAAARIFLCIPRSSWCDLVRRRRDWSVLVQTSGGKMAQWPGQCQGRAVPWRHDLDRRA